MKWGTRNLFLATTSGVAIGALAVSSALAAEEMVLPDGRTLILKDDGRYEFVDKTFDEPTEAQPVNPAAADIVVMPAAMQGARTISGTLAIYAGGSFQDGDSGTDTPACAQGTPTADCEYFALGGTGKVDLPFDLNIDGVGPDAMSLQLDVVGDANFIEDQDTDSGTPTSLEQGYGGQAVLGAHLNYREVNRYLFGLFGAIGQGHIDDTGSTKQHDADLYAVGVEGQAYFDNLTGYLQTGYMTAEAESDTVVLSDAWFVRGVGRYFFNEGRTKVAGELSYAAASQDSTDDVDIFGWGIEAEHEIHSWAGGEGFATAFIKYNGLAHGEDNGDDHYDHTFLVGLRFAINQMSMLGVDRKGATLDLPDIGRWLVGGSLVDN